jgi:hypothetical protein
MRALMSMGVELRSADGRNSGLATPEQIAEALTAVGLRPPSLAAGAGEVGQGPGEGISADAVLFRKLAGVATSIVVKGDSQAQDDVLRLATSARPGEHPPSFGGLAREHIAPEDPDLATLLALSSYALPVLMRMPARNAEDRERRKLAAEGLIYASVVTPTRSQFVASAENEGSITIRLHNQLIESLRQGCEDLLRLIRAPIPIAAGTLSFKLQGRIEIYEVGQEDSTISGRLIGFTRRDRLRFLAQTERVGVVVATLLTVSFLALFLFLVLHHAFAGDSFVPLESSPEGFVQPDHFWLGQAERLQSGMIPVLLVTGITLLVKYPRGQTIDWSQVARPESSAAVS